jgi:type IV pilus assembly protein PilX
MKTSFRQYRSRENGAVLIITLIMLIVITLATVSSVRSTTVDERMAGNARDRNKAFQAAEAAVQNCLAMLNAGSYPGTLQDPAPWSSPPLWEVAANWATGAAASYPVAMPNAELSADPRCMVERLGSTTGSFRVTGRAVGGSADTVVILQATYSNE